MRLMQEDMNNPMKLLILKDEITSESAIDEIDNQIEADFVESSLSSKYQIKQLPFSPDIRKMTQEIKDFAPDVVFNLVESICGSGALSIVAVQLLEVLGIPFTGNHIFSQIISADKAVAKHLMESKGIPTPKSCFQPDAEYILKIKTEHASMSLDDSCIRTFSSEDEMKKVLSEKKSESGFEWIAERYVDGREFNCAFLGSEILPPAEIKFAPEFVGHKILTYEAKWNEETPAYQQSLRSFDIEEDIVIRLKKLTDTCRQELNLRGYARVDFRMDKYGNLFVIDINTNPCISPDSGFVAMADRVGIKPERMFEIIIQDAYHS